MVWEVQKILQENTTIDYFGVSVSIHENYAIVGASGYDDGPSGANAGAAYFYQRKNDGVWELMDRKYGEKVGDSFGRSVSIYGNYAIVGANGYDGGNGKGAAYFYQRKNNGVWELMDTKYGEKEDDRFGEAVSIYGNYAIVGAIYYDGPAGADQGAAYFYQRKNNGAWELVDTKYGEVASDYFGVSVSIHENYAIVGASRYDGGPGGSNSGAAYFYQRKNDGAWELVDTKYGENADDRFGVSVSIYGNYAIVGAYSYDGPAGGNQGAAYIYQRKNNGAWKLMDKKGGEVASGQFGIGVSIYGNYAIVGANVAEKAYLYQRKNDGNWVEVSVQENPLTPGADFGDSVALFGNYAIVGGTTGGSGSGGVAAIYQMKY